MKKNLLYLFLLISLAANAKHLTASDSNFESKSEKDNNIVTVTSCTLNVEIAQTLDMPTSEFFVIKEALNGTAPYTYFLDGELSPNGNTFYALTLNTGIHTVTVQDANGCTGSGTFYVNGLSTAEYALPDFKFYPNPVKTILTISNTSVIDEVVFISVKGDVVLTKQINNTDAAIDLSTLSKGLYFLKINAEGTEKTIKLIKE